MYRYQQAHNDNVVATTRIIIITKEVLSPNWLFLQVSGTYTKMKTASRMNGEAIIKNKINDMTALDLGSSSSSADSVLYFWSRNMHTGVAMHRNDETSA